MFKFKLALLTASGLSELPKLPVADVKFMAVVPLEPNTIELALLISPEPLVLTAIEPALLNTLPLKVTDPLFAVVERLIFPVVLKALSTRLLSLLKVTLGDAPLTLRLVDSTPSADAVFVIFTALEPLMRTAAVAVFAVIGLLLVLVKLTAVGAVIDPVPEIVVSAVKLRLPAEIEFEPKFKVAVPPFEAVKEKLPVPALKALPKVTLS